MILVTGATGFLGAELAFQLVATADKIRCLKRVDSIIPKKLIPFEQQIDWVDADVLNLSDLEDAFEGITKVYHCAALVSFLPSLKKEMLEVNATGTANIVNLCLNMGAIKLLHVSSVAALGDAKQQELINETHFWEGFEEHDGYAVSKYRAEMEVWRGINEGLNAVIVNPSIIIGEDAGTEGSGAIFETIQKGFKYYTQGGAGFVDVKDVARGMVLLMDAEASGERFIINAENILYKDLFALAAKAFDLPIPKQEARPWMLSLAWRLNSLKNALTGQKGGLARSTAESASKIRKYDNSKIKSFLNFKFRPVEESVTKIANSLKSA